MVPLCSESFCMRVFLPAVTAAVLALVLAAPVGAQSIVSTPSPKTLYKTGPSGRYLIDGTWLFKLDNR